MTGKAQGKVRWFNPSNGYGFIAPANGGKDIFVHFTGIQADGYRELQVVEFEVEAVNVRVVG